MVKTKVKTKSQRAIASKFWENKVDLAMILEKGYIYKHWLFFLFLVDTLAFKLPTFFKVKWARKHSFLSMFLNFIHYAMKAINILFLIYRFTDNYGYRNTVVYWNFVNGCNDLQLLRQLTAGKCDRNRHWTLIY